MDILLILGILLPMLATSLGAVLVMFSKQKLGDNVQFYLNEFAAGVMMAASVFSLLLPAIEQAEKLGRFSVVPACAGFWLGMFFLAWIQKKLPCEPEELKDESHFQKRNEEEKLRLFLLAIVIHNIPEGMAVGASFAECLSVGERSLFLSAFVFSVGIAVQNLPEGAIVSLPLYAGGMKKRKACLYGILSGAVEPVAAIFTVLLSGIVIPVLPYLLGFSAGAMIYVVTGELLSGTAQKEKSQTGTLLFAAGFSFMMVLDVVFG